MKLLKIVRNSKTIEYRQEVQGHQATEERDIICQEAPLASFDEALAELSGVIIEIMELPVSWAHDITVKSMSISYTKHGTRSVQIAFDKEYTKLKKSKGEKTPFFQIDNPCENEEGERQVSDASGKAVIYMLAEATNYINGERQQQLLPLDNLQHTHEPTKGDALDFSEEPEKDWSQERIPFHADTDIPDFSSMETPHVLWYIDQQEDPKELRAELQFNYDEKLHHNTSLENLKVKAKTLACS